ncbi:uncharacterized protein FTOL_02445 [Fusarium torulosum]|uniref:NADH-ubiquinone reductase complex 1 MLRQ subunit n=1 Tax=Fusarium torulosum TaxID=33205 RepID=A0AAE8M1U3_9HYPO|nr:uncharacterized protein FTOL_02445 [Fusarium torulosum]
MELGAFWMERLKASTLSARIRWFDFPAAQCMPQAASGQWRKASGLVGPAARNCTSDVRSANSKHSFQGRQFPIESPPLDLSSTLSTPFKMRSTAALRMFRQTPRMMRPIPKEDQAGHTISQRLRKLKQIPPELYPLAVVVGFALGAATYSISRKFIVDKNLRLSRQGAAARAAGNSHGGEGESEGH